MTIINQYKQGLIKPNVENSISLYKIKNTLLPISNWNNLIALFQNDIEGTRVKFYTLNPEFKSNIPHLIYSTNALFNRRVAYLMLIDAENHKKLDENWYYTNYHPGLSTFEYIDKLIK